MQSYAAARGCDAQLNAWCDANCPHYKTHGPLLARHDVGENIAKPAWRCYAQATLSDDGSTYARGTEYCTRHMQLMDIIDVCLREGVTVATVDVTGGTRLLNEKSETPPARPPPPPPPPPLRPPTQRGRGSEGSPCCRIPEERRPVASAPHYAHTPAYLTLPPALRLPRLEDCQPELTDGALFWAASLYTSSYTAKARRLVASCEAWGVCCSPALMPDGALEGVDGKNVEGSYAVRHRLIATKPLFILSVLRTSPLPLAWMDVDLEFHSYPTLFTPAGWGTFPAPRDALLWNWQANVTHWQGRRLKMASGIAWFNKTAAAEALLLAWAETMAYEPNARAPDDQAMDLLVNDDRWIDRAAFGWLPESYLRMMPRHQHITPVIDHDRGAPVSSRGKNSALEPVLPPHV